MLTEAHLQIALGASILALAVGPAFLLLSPKRDSVVAFLRGFVQVAVVGMVLLEVMPATVGTVGPIAVGMLILGYLLPGLLERKTPGDSRLTQVLVLVGLSVHAFADGLALVSTQAHGELAHAHGHGLEAAIVLHRIPVGLAIFWMMQSRGKAAGFMAVGALAGATIMGTWFGSSVISSWFGASEEALLAALVGGLLMHVIRGDSLASEGGKRHAGMGALLGILGVSMVVVPGWTDAGSGVRRDILDTFADLFVESAPALLLAYALAGALGGVLGEASMRWMRRGGAAKRAMKGVAFGLPLPLCSCGVVPVYQSLIRRGTPAAAAVSFLVATPELGLDAVLISLPMLGADIAIARVIAAAVVAMLVGWLVGGWIDTRHPSVPEVDTTAESAPTAPLGQRLRAGLRTGFIDIVDDSATWILVGLSLAALLSPFLRPEAFANISPFVQVPLFAVIGAPIYVCATGATPLAAILIAKGASPGAALAFLLTGPATNATTFGVLERLHGRRAAFLFMSAVVVSVVGFGIATDFVLAGDVTDVTAVEAHVHGYSTVELIASAGLVALFAASLVRQGPGGFVGQLGKLANRGGDHDHDHDHEGDDPESSSSSCCG